MLALKDDLTFEYLNQELSKKDFWTARAAKYQVSDIGGYSSFARRAKRAEDAAEKLRLAAPPQQLAPTPPPPASLASRRRSSLAALGRVAASTLWTTRWPPTWSDASSSP